MEILDQITGKNQNTGTAVLARAATRSVSVLRTNARIVAGHVRRKEGVWDVFRYEDVKRGISEYETFQRGEPLTDFFKKTMLTTDPPEHGRYRDPVEDYFTPGRLRESKSKYESIVDEILDGSLKHGSDMDFIVEFAFQFPSTVMANLLGVPQEDKETFKQWTEVVEGYITR